jgi:uncharacterized membrane protein YedE/YeeE
MIKDQEFIETDKETADKKAENSLLSNLKYLPAGILFGFFLTKAEVISWFRIQEMFLLKSFHMYGVIGSAVVTGFLSLQIIKRLKIKSLEDRPIQVQPKTFHKGQIFGGLLFGFGWAMTGACPGPLFIQIGTGATIIIISLISAIAGTWLYGKLQAHLPH